jgi:hydrogenase large subunit
MVRRKTMKEITFSPVTRVSGLLSVDLLVDDQHRVYEANCIGEQFRGFELMLRDRQITDAVYFTQRVCGICSMAHGYIAARLVDQIYAVTLPPEIALLQQAMLGAEFLQNHIRHFYLLALPDYLNFQLLSEHTPTFPPALQAQNYACKTQGVFYPAAPLTREESRFNEIEQRHLLEHYFMAMEYSRKCHDMLAIFGGKIPHQHGLTAAGVAVTPTASNRIQFLALLKEIQTFIKTAMLPDVYRLAEVYRDYCHIGVRPARLISFGLFDPNLGGHYPAGIYNEGELLPLKTTEITESILFSYYQQTDSQTVPAPEKPSAYTWVKAPRYQGLAYEGGPLARKVLRFPETARHGVGVLQRLVARCEEADQIATWIATWINQLPAQGQYILPLKQPQRQHAVQIGDVPRGPLLHSINATGEQIVNYNIITPTTWNFSPKDAGGGRGPVEETLIGLRIESDQSPQLGRIIRSFDPCLSCATHLLDQYGLNKMTVKILV